MGSTIPEVGIVGREALARAFAEAGQAVPDTSDRVLALERVVAPISKDETELDLARARVAVRRFLARETKRPASTLIPPGFSPVGAKVWWGVNTGDDKLAVANAMVTLADGREMLVNVPYRQEPGAEIHLPSVSFSSKSMLKLVARVEGTVHEVTAANAAELIPFLDSILSRPGHGHGLRVVRAMLDHCEQVLASTYEPKAFMKSHHALLQRFDAGEHEAAVAGLRALAGTPTAGGRTMVYLALAETQLRLGRLEEALDAATIARGIAEREGLHFVDGDSMLVRIHRARRDFAAALPFAERAVMTMAAEPLPEDRVDLGKAYFALAVVEKNLGRLEDAVKHMQAAVDAGEGTYAQLALAGYLALAGRKSEGAVMFSRIPVPPEEEVLRRLDYHTNGAWYAAVAGDVPALISHGTEALRRAAELEFPSTREYFRHETDFDVYRSDRRFVAMIG